MVVHNGLTNIMEIEKGRLQRVNKILKIIPKDVKTILNIGSRGNMFDGYNYKVTFLDVAENNWEDTNETSLGERIKHFKTWAEDVSNVTSEVKE